MVSSSAKTWFSAIALGVCVVLTPLSVARAADVRDHLKDLASPDPRVVSEAAKALAQHPYAEVFHALRREVSAQLSSPKVNSFVVTAALESIASIATREQAPDLEALAKELNAAERRFASASLSEANSVARFWRPALEQAVELANRRKGPLEVLNPGAKDTFRLVLENAGMRTPEEIVLKGTTDFLTDNIREEMSKDATFEIFGREDEADKAIDILIRMKGKNPVYIGPAGAGKTTVAERVAQKILAGEYPQADAYLSELSGAEVISTTPARISRLAQSDGANSQAAAIEAYFDAVNAVQIKLKKPIIIFIDELHTLGAAQAEAMKPYLDSTRKGIKLIGATTGKEFSMAFKDNDAIRRRFHLIPVEEFDVEQTIKLVHKWWVPSIQRRFQMTFSPEAVEVLVKNSVTLLPDNGRFDAAVKMLQDVAIETLRNQGPGQIVDEKPAYAYVQKQLKFPVDPHDGAAMAAYEKDLIEKLNAEVIGQERMVKDLVAQWMSVLQDAEKGLRTIMFLGPTGVGKSELGRAFARLVFGNEAAFYELDANTLKDGSLALNSVFGAPNGVVSSDKTSGSLLDWKDDPSKGKFGGVMLINEVERAHKDFHERMMEMQDTAQLTGGDGKTRRFSKHILIYTSNRGDQILFPPGADRWTEAEIEKRSQSATEEELKGFFKRAISGKDDKQMSAPLLERIDKFTVANLITRSRAERIAEQAVRKFQENTRKQYGVEAEVTPELVTYVLDAHWKLRNGARGFLRSLDGYLKDGRRLALARSVPKGGKFTLSIESRPAPAVPVLVASSDANAYRDEIAMPKLKSTDPMADPELYDQLKNLEPELKSKVIGQDDAMTRLAQAVRAHKTNSASANRPFNAFVIGGPGIGKTETAKALAHAMLGDAKRAVIIPLGGIIYEGEFNDVFGSPAGHVGSETIRTFEQGLIDNQNSAVFVMDEAPNMGGRDKAQKEALFKKLYFITEEGKWTSPATNTTYDLSGCYFIWTGNSGMEAFTGMSSDDLRVATYDQLKSPDKVRKLLRDDGVPEPFIGRMTDTIMYKPLLRADMGLIADKLLGPTLEAFRARGHDVKFAENFERQLGETFFTQDQGARSVRNVIEARVGGILAEAVLNTLTRAQIESGEKLVLQLSLQDSAQRRPFRRPTEPDRKVELVVDVYVTGNLAQTLVYDLTDYADKPNRPGLIEGWTTSFHEAGHIVANRKEGTFQRFVYGTIVGRDQYLGYARYEPYKLTGGNPTRTWIIERVASLYAGSMAQQLAGFPKDQGWQQDLTEARKLVTQYLVNWGMEPKLANVRVNDKGEPMLSGSQQRIFQAAFDEISTVAEEVAEKRLKANWGTVFLVATQFMKRGSVTGDDYDRLAEKGRLLDWKYPEKKPNGKRRQQSCEWYLIPELGIPELKE